MKIGDKIKKRREEIGLTQEQLARSTGYSSKSTIAKIESNERGIKQSKVPIFAKVLGLSIQYLLMDDDTAATDEDVKFALYGTTEVSDADYELIKRIASEQLKIKYGKQV